MDELHDRLRNRREGAKDDSAAAAVSFANFFVILFPSMALRQAGIAVALQLILYGTNIMGLREGRVRRLDKMGGNGTP